MLEILPTNSSDIVVIDVCSTRALTSPSVAMVLPSSTLRCWPVAVVTTSCSLTTAISSVKSAVVVAAVRDGHRLLRGGVPEMQHLQLEGAGADIPQRVLALLVGRRRRVRAQREHACIGQRLVGASRHGPAGDGTLRPRGDGSAHRAQCRDDEYSGMSEYETRATHADLLGRERLSAQWCAATTDRQANVCAARAPGRTPLEWVGAQVSTKSLRTRSREKSEVERRSM